MKKIIRNNRLLAIAFLTIFSTGTLSTALASEPKPDTAVEFKFMGKVNNQSVFQLNFYGNTEENEVTVIIRDQFGNPLYREIIKSERFSKKFLFDMDELGDETLQFIVFGKKQKPVTYQISRKLRTVDELVVEQVE